MSNDTGIRDFAHQLVDKLEPEKIGALLDLLNEEYFSQEELEEIRKLRASAEWSDWRGVRSDL